MLNKDGKGRVVLCCNGKACPVLSVNEDNQIVIEDDYGNHIKITKEQAELIPQAITEL